VIVAIGFAIAVAVTFPDASSTVTEVHNLDVSSVVTNVCRAFIWPVGFGRDLSTVLPAASLWIWLYFLYLASKPALLCFVALGLIGIEASFLLVHAPASWHLGNVLLLIVAGAWIDAGGWGPALSLNSTLKRARWWVGAVLMACLVVVLVEHVVLGAAAIGNDLVHDFSSNRRLSELLRSDPSLAQAVVVAEPDPFVMSLPYYSTNPIYVPREGVYGSWDRFTSKRRYSYSLGDLLAAAQELRRQTTHSVVIVLGWELDGTNVYTAWEGTPFEETFTVTDRERNDFLAATRRVAILRDNSFPHSLNWFSLRLCTDELYDVYVLD
jgi:hypothetical protein